MSANLVEYTFLSTLASIGTIDVTAVGVFCTFEASLLPREPV